MSGGNDRGKQQAKDYLHNGPGSTRKRSRAWAESSPEMAESSSEKKRQTYFMDVAELTSRRSNDPKTKVGACIVNSDFNIVGIGYNHMPKGCSGIPWDADKKLYVCHAELNAVMNKNSADIKGCAIYTTLFPCNECAKVIIQSGITQVYYRSDHKALKMKTIASKKMLDMAGINCSQISTASMLSH